MPGFDGVTGAVLQWPLSVLRLRSHDRAQLLDAAEKIILAWREWTDESVGVIAHTADGVAHNTVTPVIRRVDFRGNAGGEIYEAYLALRCNITTDEHPLGVFHPHAEYHHIKKENIGLIEVMGLAILPPRLVPELGAVREHLLAAKVDASYDLAGALEGDDLCRSHAAWAEDVFARRANELTADNAIDILHEEVGVVVFGTCSTTPASLSGTKPAAPPNSASSTRCNDPLGTEENGSISSSRQRRRSATSPTGAFLNVVIGDVLKRLVKQERPNGYLRASRIPTQIEVKYFSQK